MVTGGAAAGNVQSSQRTRCGMFGRINSRVSPMLLQQTASNVLGQAMAMRLVYIRSVQQDVCVRLTCPHWTTRDRCIDRSEFPERCDEEGWTYGYNFTDFGNKNALGSGTAKALMVCFL